MRGASARRRPCLPPRLPAGGLPAPHRWVMSSTWVLFEWISKECNNNFLFFFLIIYLNLFTFIFLIFTHKLFTSFCSCSSRFIFYTLMMSQISQIQYIRVLCPSVWCCVTAYTIKVLEEDIFCTLYSTQWRRRHRAYMNIHASFIPVIPLLCHNVSILCTVGQL